MGPRVQADPAGPAAGLGTAAVREAQAAGRRGVALAARARPVPAGRLVASDPVASGDPPAGAVRDPKAARTGERGKAVRAVRAVRVTAATQMDRGRIKVSAADLGRSSSVRSGEVRAAGSAAAVALADRVPATPRDRARDRAPAAAGRVRRQARARVGRRSRARSVRSRARSGSGPAASIARPLRGIRASPRRDRHPRSHSTRVTPGMPPAGIRRARGPVDPPAPGGSVPSVRTVPTARVLGPLGGRVAVPAAWASGPLTTRLERTRPVVLEGCRMRKAAGRATSLGGPAVRSRRRMRPWRRPRRSAMTRRSWPAVGPWKRRSSLAARRIGCS